MNKPCRIVTIGGGSGQSTLLRFLKTYPVDISAIVSMVDNGGSTGKLRDQLGVMPMGDVRRCLVALSQASPDWQRLFEYRFANGDLTAHPVGNLILAALELQHGDCVQAVQLVSEWLQVKGHVIPVTCDRVQLVATLQDGTVVHGETKIDLPEHDGAMSITQVQLQPSAQATATALQAIAQADMIVLTIGDLYTSVIPNLLVTGIAEAIARSSARLVYTCNRATKWGETHGFSVLDYILTLEQYLAGRRISDVIVNIAETTGTNTSGAVVYNHEELVGHGVTVHTSDLSAADGLHVDGAKLAQAVYSLCQQ